jgi:hypothetical protein
MALSFLIFATSASASAQDMAPGSSAPPANGSPEAAPNAGSPPATGTPQRPTLQGGVNHSEELPGLDDALRPGQAFKEEILLNPETPINNSWFLIPSWYAGVRHSEDVLIVYRHFFATGQTTTPMQRQLERQDSLSGFQVDRSGGIWDYKHIPAIQHVESDLVNAVLFVKEVTPLKETQDEFVVKYEEISITLDKKKNKILQVTQQEQINSVTCPEPNLLKIDVSVKSFDRDGKPIRLEKSVVFSKITKPFEHIDSYEGQDLRPLFRDYLISHQLANLVPDDLK